jgi:hypothetical protein
MASKAPGVTTSTLQKDLEPIWTRAAGASAAANAIDQLIAEAIRTGVAERDAKKPNTLRLTARGTALATQAFPGAAKKTWAMLKKTWLVAHALGLEGLVKPAEVQALSRVTTLRLVLINQHLQLGLPAVPTGKAFERALAWHALRGGVTDAVHQWLQRQPLTLATILSALSATVGKVDPSPQKGTVYAKFAATLVGARNVNDLHTALLVRLVDAAAASTLSTDDTAFATKVLASSRRSNTGKLDDSLILINHAYDSYIRDNPADSVGLDAFKGRLLSAHGRGELELASADMPQMLDREDLDASLITRGQSRFALIRL